MHRREAHAWMWCSVRGEGRSSQSCCCGLVQTTCAVPAVGVLQSQQIRIADVSTISKFQFHQLPEISGEEEAETIKAVVNNSTTHLISPQLSECTGGRILQDHRAATSQENLPKYTPGTFRLRGTRAVVGWCYSRQKASLASIYWRSALKVSPPTI